jgi:hypothetical protein
MATTGFAGQAGGEGDGVLFGNADIEITVGVFGREAHHAGTFTHGRRNADESGISFGHVAQPVAKDLGVGQLGRAFGRLYAIAGGEFADTVIEDGVVLGQLVTLALLGDDVEELRALQLLQVFQCRDQGIEIVAVDRAVVMEAEFLEQRAGSDHALDVLFGAAGQFEQGRAKPSMWRPASRAAL